MASQWFYARGGQKCGPVTSAELKAMARNGQLVASDLIWKEGMKKWVLAASSAQLFPDDIGTGTFDVSPTPPSGNEGDLSGITELLGLDASSKAGVDPLLGKNLGDVTLVRIIAEGGMGRVYEGLQDKPRRPVAVKVMRPGFVSQEVCRRFDNEAEVLGRLRHPYIAQIYSAGICTIVGAQVPFFVMEYVADALPLTAYAKQHSLSTQHRLELFRKVCEAVAHGHEKGVIHRDLKPSNILVEPGGLPKVIDFGIARCVDATPEQMTALTDIGKLIGTVQYMSPEQFSGDSTQIDQRSDVYALGVILYELLAGRPPYKISHKQIFEAAQVVRKQKPPSPCSLNKSLRPDIARITDRCLQKDRRHRYGNANELSQALAGYLVGLVNPATCRTTPAVRGRFIAGLLVGSLLAALLSVFNWWPTRTTRQNERVIQEVTGSASLPKPLDVTNETSAKKTPDQSFDGTWRATYDNNLTFLFHIKGKTVEWGGKEITWSRAGDSLTITWPDGGFERVTVPADGKPPYFGINHRGMGLRWERVEGARVIQEVTGSASLPKPLDVTNETSAKKTPDQSFDGTWRTTHDSSANFLFEIIGGTVKCGGKEITWSRAGDSLTITWPDGGFERVTVPADGKPPYFGINHRGMGLRWERVEDARVIQEVTGSASLPKPLDVTNETSAEKTSSANGGTTQEKHPPRDLGTAFAPTSPPDEGTQDARDTTDSLRTLENSVGMTLIEIPAGSFMMGSPENEPGRRANELQVRVIISQPFLMSHTEVTQHQWEQVMHTKPWSNVEHAREGPDFPACNVTWEQANEFCQKLTALEHHMGLTPLDVHYSLPTEAQWEYACRAGSTSAYSCGESESSLVDHAWYTMTTLDSRHIHEVSMKRPNHWGLYDMHGNVWEWCNDFSIKEPASTDLIAANLVGGTDPQGPHRGEGHVFRGGGWDYWADCVRSARRDVAPASHRFINGGFRVVRNVANQ